MSLIRSFRPFLNKLKRNLAYLSSNNKLQVHPWQQKYNLHLELFQNKQKFDKQMNDQRLQEYINSHYFLGDIVTIANFIAKQSTLYNRELTDTKIAFLAFTYNLYHHETAKIPELIEIISSHLLKKIAEKDYNFGSKQIQNNYFQQIYFLTYRQNIPYQIYREITINLVRFIQRKFGIDQESMPFISDETLDRLWQTLAYIPIQNGTNALIYYQNLLLKTISYEALQLKVKRDKEFAQKDILNQGIKRFSMLAELCIRVSNSRNKYIDIFDSLPTEFNNLDEFADWMVVLREFMIQPLAKRLDYKKMDIYHGKIAQKNRKYNRRRGYLNIQSYCQSLLFLNIYNPRPFSNFFEDDNRSQ